MERRSDIFSFQSRLPIYGSRLSRSLRQNCVDSLNFIQRLRLEKKLEVHQGCVNTICWDDSGTVILSGSDDKKLCVTDPFSRRVLAQAVSGHRSNIFSAQFLPFCQNNQVVSCSGDGQISYTIMDREDTHGTNMFLCHYGTTYEVVTVPGDPHTFLSCGEDGSVRWFDLRTKTSCRKDRCKSDILINCRRAVTTLAVNPMQPYHLAVGCSDSSVRVFDRRVLGTRAQGSSYSGRGIHAMFSRLCPPHMKKKYSRPTSLNYDSNGEELLVSYSTDYIYIFNLGDDDEGAKECAIAGDAASPPTNEEQGDSVNPVKRLRLRGDWSDTGPKARPRSERDEGGERGEDNPPPRVTIVQRMSEMLSRWLEDTTPQHARTLRDERRTSGDREEDPSGGPQTSQGSGARSHPKTTRVGAGSGTTGKNVQLRTVIPYEAATPGPSETERPDDVDEAIGSPKEKKRKTSPKVPASAATSNQPDKETEVFSGKKKSRKSSGDEQERNESDTRGMPSQGETYPAGIRGKGGASKMKKLSPDKKVGNESEVGDGKKTSKMGHSKKDKSKESSNEGPSASSELVERMEVDGDHDDDDDELGISSKKRAMEGSGQKEGQEMHKKENLSSERKEGSAILDGRETMEVDDEGSAGSALPDGRKEESNTISRVKRGGGDLREEQARDSRVKRDSTDVGEGKGIEDESSRDGETMDRKGDTKAKRDRDSNDEGGRKKGTEVESAVGQDEKEKGGKVGSVDGKDLKTSGPDRGVDVKESSNAKKQEENSDTCLPLKERQEDWNPKDRATKQFADPPPRRRKVSVCGAPGQGPSSQDSAEPSTSERPQTRAEESVSDLRSRFESGNVIPAARPRPRRVSPSRRLPAFSREVLVNSMDMDMSDTDSEFDSEDDLILQRPTRGSSSSTEDRDPEASLRESAVASKSARLKEFFKNHRMRKEKEEEEMLKKVKSPKVKMVFKGHRNSRTMIKEATFWGNNHVLSGSDCGHIFVWDRHTGRLVMLLEGDRHVVNCIQPHPTDPILATSGIDYDIKIWTPSAEEPQMPTDAKEVIRINEVMLEETRDTITIPPAFMLRMLASLNHLRTDSRATGEEPDSDSSAE